MATITEDCSLSNDIVSSTPYKVSGAKKKSKDETEADASVHEYSFKTTSWVELIDKGDDTDSSNQEITREEGELSTTTEMSYLSNVKSGLEDSSSVSQPREFAIEILDASNEAKFDRLLKEEKIKSPFRRQPSNEAFDEARKVELESIKNHDPSILDFKVAAEFIIPTHVAESVLAESEEACDGFEASSDRQKSPMKRKHIEKVIDSGETDTKKARFGKPRTHSSCSSEVSGKSGGQRRVEFETDPEILERRQKNIDYGKNTVAYDNYIQEVPKHTRTKEHPRTPPKQMKYSRRAWDGLVKQWRKQLHTWDTDNKDDETIDEEEEEQVHY